QINRVITRQAFQASIQIFVWPWAATPAITHIHANLRENEAQHQCYHGICKYLWVGRIREREIHPETEHSQGRHTCPLSDPSIPFNQFFVFDDFHFTYVPLV